VHWSQAIRLRQPITYVFKLLVVEPTVWLVITLPWINGLPTLVENGTGRHLEKFQKLPHCFGLMASSLRRRRSFPCWSATGCCFANYMA
jgi:hypothetical protein